VLAGDGGVGFDGDQVGVAGHPGQQPRGADPGAGAQDWANTVAVGISERYDPVMAQRVAEHFDELDWVADRVDRQLIRIDTNYKPTCRSVHPVDLTRTDAVG
jgi:hypothetical protein